MEDFSERVPAAHHHCKEPKEALHRKPIFFKKIK
jgi:hypothetical protein